MYYYDSYIYCPNVFALYKLATFVIYDKLGNYTFLAKSSYTHHNRPLHYDLTNSILGPAASDVLITMAGIVWWVSSSMCLSISPPSVGSMSLIN